MKLKCLFLSLLLVIMLGMPSRVQAETTFEFSYQRIEKVVQVNNPEPKGLWENVKAFGKGLVNSARKLWSNEVQRNFFPGEGEKMWYSKKDPNIAYQMQRVKVKSAQHLLELMGAKGVEDLDSLTDGQKALYAMYLQSQSEALKERQPYTYRDKVKVMLTDTTGFEDERKYPHVTRDFWPNSSGFSILMNSKRYNYPRSEDDARSTFMHEFAHTMDRTWQDFFSPYGKDGSHFVNEMTRPRTAWLEGYAIFNEMIEFPSEATYSQNAIKKIKIESKTEAGKYTSLDRDDPSLTGLALLSVEGINAQILYRLAKELPDGKKKVLEATAKTNYPWRSLRQVTRYLAENNPEHIRIIGNILNEETQKRLSDEELLVFLGNSDGARTFSSEREKSPVSAQMPLPPGVLADGVSQPRPSLGVIIDAAQNHRKNPFVEKEGY